MASRNDEWLERIAGAADTEARIHQYDLWAATYDEDMRTVGYANSAVAAALVCRHIPACGARILDAGVGTGALGEILRAVGYTDLVGIDSSDGMLAKARERNVYRELRKLTLGEPLPFPDQSFTAVVAMGVFAFGAAPPAALDELVRVTKPNGHVIFSVAEPPWENGGFKSKAEAFEIGKRWERVAIAGPYRPMPHSAARAEFTTRAFVYRVSA